MNAFSASDRALRILAALEANAVDDGAHVDSRLFDLAAIYARCAEHIRLMDEDDAYALAFGAAAQGRQQRNARALAAGVEEAIADLDINAARARLEDAIPAVAAASERGRQTACGLAMARELAAASPDLPIWRWSIEARGVTALLASMDVDESRAVLAAAAERNGLAYSERPNVPGTSHRLEAQGVVRNIRVLFYDTAPGAQLPPAPAELPPLPDVAERYAEQSLKRLDLAARLQIQTIDVAADWRVEEHRIDVMLDATDPAECRKALADVAAKLGVAYADEDAKYSPAGSRLIQAAGDIEGVRVEFWSIVQDPDEQFAEAVESFEEAAAAETAALADVEPVTGPEHAEEPTAPSSDEIAGNEIFAGDVFDTDYELGCIATTDSDEQGNFDGLDSDGVECAFNLSMIVRFHPRSETDGMTNHDVMSAEEIFEFDQACEAAADYATSLEPGLEADL